MGLWLWREGLSCLQRGPGPQAGCVQKLGGHCVRTWGRVPGVGLAVFGSLWLHNKLPQTSGTKRPSVIVTGSEGQKFRTAWQGGFLSYPRCDLQAGVTRVLGTMGTSGERIHASPVYSRSVFGEVGLPHCMAAGLQA